MDLTGRHILVVGMARTGVSAARFLASRGARVTVTDQRDEIALAGVMEELGALDIRWVLGRHDESDFTSADLIVVSPGVPQDHPLLAAAQKAGREIVSEIELASRFIAAPLVAITGTNGKTTPRSMV